MHYRDIFESKLSKEDAYQCALWAFGEGFENIPMYDIPERWNHIHIYLFTMKDTDNLIDSIDKIVEAWKRYKKIDD